MLEDFLRAISEKENREKVFVGRLPAELNREFDLLARQKKRLSEDIELRKKQFELEYERKMKEEFDYKQDQVEEEHNAMWNKIYTYLNLDPQKEFTYRDGQIYQYAEKEQNGDLSQIFDFQKPNDFQ